MTIDRETYTRFVSLAHKLSRLAHRADVANIIYRDMGYDLETPEKSADLWLLLDIKAMMKVASQLRDMYKTGEVILEGEFGEGFIEEATAAQTFGIPAALVADIEWNNLPTAERRVRNEAR